MDLKTDDLKIVEFDLCSEVEKLNLGNIPNDFLDKISKFDKQHDIENILLPVEVHKIKCADEVSCKEFKSSVTKSFLFDDKLGLNDPNGMASLDKPKVKKDINGNDSFTEENLENLIIKYKNLELSDSDNEEDEEESSELTERGGPDRAAAQRKRNREQNLTKKVSYDRSQFNSATLKHLSGSYNVQQRELPMTNHLLHGVDFSNILGRNQTSNLINYSAAQFDLSSAAISASQKQIAIPSAQNISSYKSYRPSFLNNSAASQNDSTILPISHNSDSLYDSAPNFINSPESGYDTSHSITGSPPRNLPSPEGFLDSNSENIIDQEVIDIVLDFEFGNSGHSFSTAHNSVPFNLDAENPKEEILHFLKDIPTVLNELPHTGPEAGSEYIQTELNNLFHTASLDQSNFVETELVDLPPSLPSEVNCKQISAELNDLLSAPSSQTTYDQVLKELNDDLSTVSCKPLLKDPGNLPLATSSETTCDYVPLANNSAVIDSSTSEVPLVLCQSNQNNSETPIAPKPSESKAKNALRNFFKKNCEERFRAVHDAYYRKLLKDRAKDKKIRVIYIEDEDDKNSERQTNLHKAVLNENLIDVYCLVEINISLNGKVSDPYSDLNLRDNHKKTALDYAIDRNLKLVADFLIEKNACQSVRVKNNFD